VTQISSVSRVEYWATTDATTFSVDCRYLISFIVI